MSTILFIKLYFIKYKNLLNIPSIFSYKIGTLTLKYVFIFIKFKLMYK